MGRYSGKKCRLVSMFFLTSSFFLVEIVVGHLTNSMALVADSFHMLSDIAALIIAFISVRMSPKSWDKNTYGWARAEVLGKKSPITSIVCVKELDQHFLTDE
jgi:cation diffusion facilitator family transporter